MDLSCTSAVFLLSFFFFKVTVAWDWDMSGRNVINPTVNTQLPPVNPLMMNMQNYYQSGPTNVVPPTVPEVEMGANDTFTVREVMDAINDIVDQHLDESVDNTRDAGSYPNSAYPRPQYQSQQSSYGKSGFGSASAPIYGSANIPNYGSVSAQSGYASSNGPSYGPASSSSFEPAAAFSFGYSSPSHYGVSYIPSSNQASSYGPYRRPSYVQGNSLSYGPNPSQSYGSSDQNLYGRPHHHYAAVKHSSPKFDLSSFIKPVATKAANKFGGLLSLVLSLISGGSGDSGLNGLMGVVINGIIKPLLEAKGGLKMLISKLSIPVISLLLINLEVLITVWWLWEDCQDSIPNSQPVYAYQKPVYGPPSSTPNSSSIPSYS